MESSRDDELMADPPASDHHLGRFAGYRAADRLRRRITIAMVVAVIASVVAVYFYIRQLQRERAPIYAAPLPPGTDFSGRSRTMTWSSGKARLALTREPPGIDTIALPDRIIRLAEGAESAELRVDVVDGRTVERTLIRGQIREEPVDAAARPLSPP
ncbi:MAG: hypothetical protein IPK80_10295 [Nannocystis sp.]|nr:hypothetical protein [Nannocystis sp.]